MLRVLKGKFMKAEKLDFYKICAEIEKENKEKKQHTDMSIDIKAQQEYAMFCCWSRAFNNNDFGEKSFKKYQKQENIKFDFWLKKRIAELFFGYNFKFDNNKQKWILYK